MVLNDIADGPGHVVKSAAALYSEIFRHVDLYALDIMAVPECFGERVREAKDQHVVHRPLAEEVIDAENTGLVEDGEEDFIQLQGGSHVMPEGFFDDDSRTASAIRFRDMLHHAF